TLNELVPLLRELLAKFDAKISEVQIEYGEDRVGDIKHSLASIKKASSLLGYQPEYSLQKGLSEAIEWYWNDLK
ncbi:MAG: LPS biosynthesis protein WbpP, partial [Flavobacteriales bacterium]|nr:LPS biosynthesis protein WbpP [Flavobacteriales bacterium]